MNNQGVGGFWVAGWMTVAVRSEEVILGIIGRDNVVRETVRDYLPVQFRLYIHSVQRSGPMSMMSRK